MDFDLFKLSDKPGRYAVPNKHTGAIDVVTDYRWTITDPTYSAMGDVPTISLSEYQVTGSQLSAAAGYWLRQVVGLGIDVSSTFGLSGITGALEGYVPPGGRVSPYEGLYRAIPTGFSYKFPYFNPFRRSLQNTWADSTEALDFIDGAFSVKARAKATQSSGLGSLVTGLAGQVIRNYNGPSVGMERQKVWSNTSDQEYVISFDLLNTISPAATQANFELISLLSYQNTYYRSNVMLSYPPCIYTVHIPGVRTCPVAIIRDVQIVDMGAKRLFRSSVNSALNNKALPEAFSVSLTVVELVPESRNILEGLFEDNVITAITESSLEDDTDPFVQALKRPFQSAADTAPKTATDSLGNAPQASPTPSRSGIGGDGPAIASGVGVGRFGAAAGARALQGQ